MVGAISAFRTTGPVRSRAEGPTCFRPMVSTPRFPVGPPAQNRCPHPPPALCRAPARRRPRKRGVRSRRPWGQGPRSGGARSPVPRQVEPGARTGERWRETTQSGGRRVLGDPPGPSTSHPTYRNGARPPVRCRLLACGHTACGHTVRRVSEPARPPAGRWCVEVPKRVPDEVEDSYFGPLAGSVLPTSGILFLLNN